MGVIDSITPTDSLVLDTNILISAINKSASYSTNSIKLLNKIREVNPKVFISTIAFEEFFVQIYKKKLEKDIPYFEDFIAGGGLFTVVDVNRQIAIRAAKIRAEYNLRAPDAIHLSTGLEVGAKLFLTADKRFPKKIDSLKIETII